MLEISLDKELTAKCLVETRTKLKELITASMVGYGLTAPLVVAAVSDGMVCLWDTVVSKHL